MPMNYRVLFEREDGTGYPAAYLARDAEAVAYGNGYDAVNISDPDWERDVQVRNTIAHAHGSADWAYEYGDKLAEKIFDWKEGKTPTTYESPDEYADQWNNEVGRRIAQYAKDNSLDQSDIDDLIMDAFQNGELIWDRNNDPRIDLNGDPKTDPTWSAPSQNWEGASAGRDYSEADEFDEDPIGLYDQIAQKTGLYPIVTPPSFTIDVAAKFLAAILNGSPLVLDLNDSGIIDLISLANSETFWDIDQDGFAELSGWVSSSDGLLAMDHNQDGIINDNGELFGTLNTDGFTILAQYDSNYDGSINNEDADWGDLLVWQDHNENGYSEDGELYSLSDFDIVSIDLNATEVSQTNQGHDVTHTSTFTVDDGINPPDVRIVHDVWFEYSDMQSVYNDEIEIDPLTLYLPTLRGYGEIADTLIAATLDTTLRDQLADLYTISFAAIFTDDTSALDEAVTDIMYRWAGVDGVDPSSRGPNIDARTLEFLEKMMGQDFLQRGWSPNPGSWSAVDLEEAFHIAHANFLARLVAQGAGGDLFTGDFYYNLAADNLDGVTGLDHDTIDNLETLGLSMTSPEVFWANVVRVIEYTVGTANLSTGDADYLEDAIQAALPTVSLQDVVDSLDFSAPDGVSVGGTAGNDTLAGGVGDDTVDGGYGDDELDGGLGNDTLYGGPDEDVLTGGAGSDYVLGGSGDDRYVYNVGHGHDVYGESGSGTDDRIVFGSGITLNDLTISRVGNTDLLIEIDNGTYTGSIIVENQFNYSPGGDHIELLEFADASTYRLDDKNYTQIGSAGDDTLYGTAAGGLDADTIYGGDGNDTIYGGAPNQNDYEINTLYGEAGADKVYGDRGDDVVDGGSGNDYLYGDTGADSLTGGTGDDIVHGGSGADIYYYNLGDGNDTYKEQSSDTDKIVFGAGITQQNLTFSRFGIYNVVIEIAGGGSIMIERQTNAGTPIETLEFADTSTLDMATVDITTYGTSAGETISGVTPGDGASGVDTIYAGDGDDTVNAKGNTSYEYLANTLYGEGGNDTLNGNRGADTIYGGDGNDAINADSGDDVLTGGAGDDYIYGAGGADTYYYNLGDGDDTFKEYGSDTDKIVFGAGITFEDLTFTRDADNDVLIEIAGGGSIMIEDHTNSGRHIETMEFADSSTVDFNTIDFVTYGTAAGESINGARPDYGAGGVDTIYAGDGNDTVYAKGTNSYEYVENYLYGEGGDDTLYGDRGNDTLSGGSGNDYLRDTSGGDDTLIYESGLDIIYNIHGSNDTLVIDNGYTVNDMTYTTPSNNHLIVFDSGIDEISLTNAGYGGNYTIENIVFSDGFETDQFGNAANWIWGTGSYDFTTGTVNDDVVVGRDGDDDLSGNTGDDDIHGGSGADTIDGGADDDFLHGGTGDDMLYGGSGNDVLYGGDGADSFVFESGTTSGFLDAISDFSVGEGDILDIADIISYDPMTDLITDFVQITDNGTDSFLAVDADGGADNFVQIASLLNVTGLTDEAALETSGTLIAA